MYLGVREGWRRFRKPLLHENVRVDTVFYERRTTRDWSPFSPCSFDQNQWGLTPASKLHRLHVHRCMSAAVIMPRPLYPMKCDSTAQWAFTTATKCQLIAWLHYVFWSLEQDVWWCSQKANIHGCTHGLSLKAYCICEEKKKLMPLDVCMLLLRAVRVKWTVVNDMIIPDRSARLPPLPPPIANELSHYHVLWHRENYIHSQEMCNLESALTLSSALI